MSSDLRSVLIVDDDDLILRLLYEMIDKQEFAVTLYQHPTAALEWIAENDPVSIVVVDVMMPTLGGEDFVKRLRADPRYATIPILMLSAHHKAAQIAEQCGANGIVRKPFTATDIRRALNKWTGGPTITETQPLNPI